jgi:hypothetical protein
MLITHSLAPPRSIRPLHRPVAAPTFPINATGKNATWKSAREAIFRGGVLRDIVAGARGEAPSGPRWAAPGLRAVPRSVSPVSCSLMGGQADRQASSGGRQLGRHFYRSKYFNDTRTPSACSHGSMHGSSIGVVASVAKLTGAVLALFARRCLKPTCEDMANKVHITHL